MFYSCSCLWCRAMSTAVMPVGYFSVLRVALLFPFSCSHDLCSALSFIGFPIFLFSLSPALLTDWFEAVACPDDYSHIRPFSVPQMNPTHVSTLSFALLCPGCSFLFVSSFCNPCFQPWNHHTKVHESVSSGFRTLPLFVFSSLMQESWHYVNTPQSKLPVLFVLLLFASKTPRYP